MGGRNIGQYIFKLALCLLTSFIVLPAYRTKIVPSVVALERTHEGIERKQKELQDKGSGELTDQRLIQVSRDRESTQDTYDSDESSSEYADSDLVVEADERTARGL